MNKFGVNIIIETEKVENKTIFIASSPDINVFVEGSTIEEAKEKFIDGVKSHLKTFPEEKQLLMQNKEYDMPLVTKVFL